jgi:SAM-dependent methyltransferase
LHRRYFDTVDAPRAIGEMRGYAADRPELDKLLDELAAPYLSAGSLAILDAACGIGHLAPWLVAQSPGSTYVGIDEAQFLIDEAKRLHAMDRVRFERAPVQQYAAGHAGEFDVVISWKTLSWLEHYDLMLPDLVRLARRAVFVSSLFYDGDIDCQIRVTEHAQAALGARSQWFYNVYSLPRFASRARELGATSVTAHDFEIPIDLPRGDRDRMGTYTRRLDDGRRLQFSGPLAMPWKVVVLEVS